MGFRASLLAIVLLTAGPSAIGAVRPAEPSAGLEASGAASGRQLLGAGIGAVGTTVEPASLPASAAEAPRLATEGGRRAPVWMWPVPEPHPVVRGFDPPGAPWGAGHRGVDLATEVGGPVVTPTDGVISFAGVIAGRPVLVVAHAEGLRSTFEPIATSHPVGTSVARGQVVGMLTASPGHCSPASCLHWGVLRGAVYLDPLGFVRQQVVLLPVRGPP
jgi:murein DD-endopeptidase MepM/ murein hydrolase activator NlpD